jgi:cellulose synthase/poly-beta-1,6-N-acetylglucosamine synthase-like glycosyltransferase
MSNEPKICVLIPAFNEEQVIEGTINALRASGFNQSDIYIVDDMSTDATSRLARSKGVHVYTVTEKGGNKARAQVLGFKHFNLHEKYTHVIFLDADTKVEPQFLNVMFEAAEKKPNTTLFVGQVKSAENSHIFSALRAYEYTYGQELVKRGQSNFNVIFVSPGCASMYKLADLVKLKIEDDTLAEDMDLTIQVHRMKGKIRYVHRAAVVTQDPSNFEDYNKQIMRWYRGFWQIALKHRVFSWGKKQPVDLYMIYSALSALFFNPVLGLIVGAMMFPVYALAIFFLGNLGIFMGIAVFVACRTRRLDVLYRAPAYYWITYLNFFAFTKSFFEVIVCRKDISVWNKVKRYEFNS